MEKKVIIATILVLSQALFLHAFPFLPPPTEAPAHNATEEGSGGSGDETNEENEDQSSSILLNDYVIRFFQQQRHLKERNCSTQFLGQSVSRHLCNSTNVNFRFPEGTEYNETQKTYELCSNVSGAGKTVGFDVILYMRPSITTNSTAQRYLVIITEIVREREGDPWLQILAHKTILGDTARGWKVFHLAKRQSTNTTFCFKIDVRDRQRRLLNHSSISEMFVTDKNRPHELYMQPVIAQYICTPQPSLGVSPFVPSLDPFPFYFSGSTAPPPTETPTGSRRKRSNECRVEENPVNLSEYYPDHQVVAPNTVNIRRCSWGATHRVETGEVKQQSFDGLCGPTQFEDLTVLRYSTPHNTFFTDTIPKSVIQKCGHVAPTGKM